MQISETLSGMPHKLTCCFAVGDLKTSIHFFFLGQFVKAVARNVSKSLQNA